MKRYGAFIMGADMHSISRTFLGLASLALLSACASVDLAKSGAGLSERDRAVAQRMAELMGQRCVRYVALRSTGERYTGDVNFSGAAEIRRLYSSADGIWYKADAVNEGAWGSLYYNQRSGFFLCGEKNWSALPQLKDIVFSEVQNSK
jgi:hypothetical protein